MPKGDAVVDHRVEAVAGEVIGEAAFSAAGFMVRAGARAGMGHRSMWPTAASPAWSSTRRASHSFRRRCGCRSGRQPGRRPGDHHEAAEGLGAQQVGVEVGLEAGLAAQRSSGSRVSSSV